MYALVRRLFFLQEPEAAHYTAMNGLKRLCAFAPVRHSLRRLFRADDPRLAKTVFGLPFKNPIGLGAGFDKNAAYLNELEVLGFGFVEVGTVTPRPQAGNEKPRLFRLVKDKALINRMGFNNDGVEVVAKRLKEWKEKKRPTSNDQRSRPEEVSKLPMLIGGNIGKNKTTPNEDAWRDYEICFNALHPHVDFFVVNVSSPNTPGLRELQEKDALKKILTHLQQQNQQYEKRRPILLKIAPDLTNEQIDDVIDLAQEIKLDGLVATNTTTSREHLVTGRDEVAKIGAGGLSGAPVRKRATEVVRYIHQKTGGAIPIIASGGIFTAQDAQEKFAAGAALCEVWTGFIYEGPAIVRTICQKLVQ